MSNKNDKNKHAHASHAPKKHDHEKEPKVEESKPEVSKAPEVEAPAHAGKNSVLMKFSEDKYYNDLNKPIFEKGKIYELQGEGWIHRWMKRGGEIVESAKASEVEAKVESPPPAVPVVKPEGVADESGKPEDGKETDAMKSGS